MVEGRELLLERERGDSERGRVSINLNALKMFTEEEGGKESGGGRMSGDFDQMKFQAYFTRVTFLEVLTQPRA